MVFGHWRFALLVIFSMSLADYAHAASARAVRTLLFIPYRGDDLSFSEAAYRGYERLQQDGYAISIVENADKLSASTMMAIIDKYYASGTHSFILAGAEMSAVTATAAQRHPDAYFATLAGHATGTNVINYCLDCRQIGGALAGRAAVQLSRSKIIGFVGGVESVDGAEAQRFKETVMREAPHAKVLIDWTHNWSDRQWAAQLAERQIQTGADVVVSDANVAAIVAASRHPRVRVISWMADASRQYPSVAASVIIDTDVVFRRFIAAVASGHFNGGEYVVDEADNVWIVVWPRKPQ